MSLVSWISFFALAALVGFFADRTSICTVKAIEEILTSRRAYMLLSFGKTVLWVVGVTVWLLWWIRAEHPDLLGFAITWSGLFGGVLFGVGAVFNHGCAFATLKRLGNGNLGMLVTLSGFAVGVALYELLPRYVDSASYVRARPLIEFGFGTATLLGALITAWMAWEIVRLWRSAPSEPWWRLLLANKYRLSTAAAAIGLSNGILYALLGTWSFTHTIRRSVGEVVSPDHLSADVASIGALWSLFAALVLGVLISSLLRRRFEFAWRPRGAWHGYFWGGILMGAGAAFIPGGNDVLLLNAIPGMSPHALPAYLAMLAGVVLGLFIIKWRGQSWDIIDCRDDLCRAPDGTQPD